MCNIVLPVTSLMALSCGFSTLLSLDRHNKYFIACMG